MDEIITEGSLHDWGIQAIHGVIYVHWVLRKNDILKNSVKELIARSTDSENEEEKNFCSNPNESEKVKSVVVVDQENLTAPLKQRRIAKNNYRNCHYSFSIRWSSLFTNGTYYTYPRRPDKRAKQP